MNTSRYLELVQDKKGQFIKLSWRRNVKTAACNNHITLEKKTITTVRTGINYDNIGVVQEMRANGMLPAQNAGLPFGEWAVFPYVINYKGVDYARIYPAQNSHAQVEWFADGHTVDPNYAISLLTPSDQKAAKEKHKPACFTVKMVDILVP